MADRDYERRRRKSNQAKRVATAKRAPTARAPSKGGSTQTRKSSTQTQKARPKRQESLPPFRMPSVAAEDRKTYRSSKPKTEGTIKRTRDPKNERPTGKTNIYERFQRIRERRIVRRAGKALIHNEAAMLTFLLDNKVPTMMQHCILKVYTRMPGQPKERCISAFNICAATFQKHGYMRPGTMSPTGKGMKRNRMHQREKVASQKKQRFWQLMNRLWRAAFARIEKDRRNTGA